MGEKLKALIKSRRWWTAVGAVVVVSVNETLNVPTETAQTIVAICISWILADSIKKTE